MLVAKQVADLITFLRLLVTGFFIWLGVTTGRNGLPIAAWTMLFSWTSDALDGPIARRSKIKYSSWIGDHDLQVDMAVCTGLIVFLMLAGLVPLYVGFPYIAAWSLFFWRFGIERSPGMLYQAAPYAILILAALRFSTPEGIALVSWIAGLIVLTWPRFPNEVIPGFLSGMRGILHLPRKFPK